MPWVMTPLVLSYNWDKWDNKQRKFSRAEIYGYYNLLLVKGLWLIMGWQYSSSMKSFWLTDRVYLAGR